MHIKVLKKNKIFLKFFVVVIVLIICVSSLIRYFKGNILPVISTMSEATVRSMAVVAINNAAHIVLDDTINYEELVHIVKNNNGDIDLIQSNTVKINRLARDLENLAEKNVESIEEQTVSLPIGAFTGSVILAGTGPSIDVRLLPIGSVACDFVSNFEEVGINQTKHSIYINANTTINIILPVSSVPVTVTTSILVVENIIIGKVPDFYLNNNDNIDNMDLIPNKYK